MELSQVEAIVLVGGFGTRLRSVVSDVPKCLAKIGDRTCLEWVLQFLGAHKISRVVLATGYQGEQFTKFVQEMKLPPGMKVSISHEQEPLGTGGGAVLASQKINSEHLLVVNGDTLFLTNLNDVFETHVHNRAKATLALAAVENASRYGTVTLGQNQQVLKFVEKQGMAQPGNINAGIIFFHTKVLKDRTIGKLSMEQDVMTELCSEKTAFGNVGNGYFIDIGIPEDFHRANLEVPTRFQNWQPTA